MTSFPPFPWRQILVLCCAVLILTALWAEAAQDRLADHVIRLHVLANSDSEADQSRKLVARDAVLLEARKLLSGEESIQEAARILAENLDPLAKAASQALTVCGCQDPVRVTLEPSWFPTRHYQGIALPAGTYQALRVVIGEGKGKNWWCMIYPSLCLSAVSETSVQAAGLNGSDYTLLTDAPYTLRFKAVEWWELCKHALSPS